jgi:hypothetical protein
MVRKLLATSLFFLAGSFSSLPLSASRSPIDAILEPGPGFTLHPNPVTGTWFHINLSFSESDYPNARFSISNVLGEVIYAAPIKKTEFAGAKVRVDIEDIKLDKGVYFIQVFGGDKSKILRLVVR